MTTQTHEKTPPYYYGTGRRKTAIARVRLYTGGAAGGILVNKQSIDEFFCVDQWIKEAMQPLEVTELKGKVTVKALTHGGGIHGQAGAFSHGLARALVAMDETLRPVLKKAGLLRRDPRMKESKKYGLLRARKAPQYTKR